MQFYQLHKLMTNVNCTNIYPTFSTSSYRFRYQQFYMFTSKGVDQGHGIQFSQLLHSMANVYSSSPTHFSSIVLTVSKIYKFQTFDFHKVGQGHGVHFSQLHHSMANVKIYKHHFVLFILVNV